MGGFGSRPTPRRVCSAAWPTSPDSSTPPRPATRRPRPSCCPLVYDELRKLAAARTGRGEAGPDAPGHRPGPRGVPPARRAISRRTGTAAATSSPPPPRPCAASSSTTPAASSSQKRGGERRRVDLDAEPCSPTRTTGGRRPAGPRRGPRPLAAATTRPRRELVEAPLLRRADRSEQAADALGISAGHGRAPLGVRPRLALRRTGRRGPSRTIFRIAVSRLRPPFLALMRQTAGRRPMRPTAMTESKTIFVAALEIGGRGRPGRVTSTRRAAATPTCGRRVEQLLDDHDRAGSFLESPAPARRHRRPTAASRRAAGHRRSARTSCWSRSAKAASASSSWPSRPSRSAARSR